MENKKARRIFIGANSIGWIKLPVAMSFCFKRKEPVRKAVRRICGERLGKALKDLKGGGRMDAVHEVRREIKKLRSALRLVRGDIGKKDYRRFKKALRQAANHLTATRDAQVRLNAFEKLGRHFGRKFPASSFSEIRAALRKSCRQEEERFRDSRSAAKACRLLRKLRHHVRGLKTASAGWSAIAPGLTRGYGRGREALAVVRKNPSPESFHEWRKRVKDHWHHLRLLCPSAPGELRVTAKKLDALGTFLGDDHDLTLLEEFVAGGKFKRPAATRLSQLINLRQRELRRAALKSGARLYAESPEHFCRRREVLWKRWRDEGG